jgi:hypothetical protein
MHENKKARRIEREKGKKEERKKRVGEGCLQKG